MLTELYDGRTAVSSPAVAPDGRRIAFVVSTIDLEGEHDTHPRVAGRPRRSRPAHRRARRRPAGVVARRALPGLHVAARREGQGDHAARDADRRTGRGAHGGDACPRASPTCAWSPDGKHGWRSPAAPATPATTPRTRAGSRRAGSRRSSPASTARAGSSTGRRTCTWCRPTAPATPRNLTPGPFQHDGVSWLADSSGVVTSAPRHDRWDLDYAEDLYLVPLDGEIRALTHADRHRTATRRCPPTARAWRSSAPTTRRRTRRTPGVGVIADRRRADRVGRRRARPDVLRHRRRAGAGLARRRRPSSPPPRIAARRTSTASPPTARRRRSRSPTGALSVQTFDAAGWTIAMAAVHRRAPGRARDARGLDAAGRHGADARAGSGWERSPCRAPTAPTRSTPGSCGRPSSTPSQRYPVLLNVHGGPFTQYGETFFDEAQMQAAAGFVVRDVQPTRRQRAAHGVGPGDHRAQAPDGAGHRVGQRRRRRRARRARRTPWPRTRSATATGSACSAAATAATWRRCWPAAQRPLPGDLQRAGVNNMLSEECSSDIGTVFRVDAWVSTRSRIPTSTCAMSPIRLAQRHHVPMLIIHSEDDLRCPINQAEELFVACALLGRDVTFYRFPGESHELSPQRLAGAPPDARRDHPRLLHRPPRPPLTATRPGGQRFPQAKSCRTARFRVPESEMGAISDSGTRNRARTLENACGNLSPQGVVSQASMSLRAMEIGPGSIGRSSRRYQRASTISSSSSTNSPDT